jgi:DNA-binding transcriptional regulator YhcF (GntR family)
VAKRTERREKMFGLGHPRALDRNAKVRIMHWARCLSRRTEKGRAYGQVTAKALAVLEALLCGFHNAKSGICFPSYERIAQAAGCARSTVAQALRVLEDAKILSWIHRIKRIREPCLRRHASEATPAARHNRKQIVTRMHITHMV